jgi:uncharacterized protein YqjF (DUF2071 family)
VASWRPREPEATAEPGSLEFFQVERYCLYAHAGGRLYRARIWHEPWPLRQASLVDLTTTMWEADGLPAPGGAPRLLAAGPVHVDIWPLMPVH